MASLSGRSKRRLPGLPGVVAVAGVIFLMSACSPGSKSSEGTVNAVDCDVSGAGTVSVNVLAYNSSSTDPFSDTMVKSCSIDGVTVKHAPIDFAGQYQKTATTLAGGQGTYDIIEMYSGAVPGYANKQKLVPLDDLFKKYKDQYGLDEIEPAMLKGLSYDGKLYALPTMANIMTMVYRKDVFDGLGLKAPSTYTELLEDAKKIQAAGKFKHPVAMPLADNTSTLYEQLMSAQGSSYVRSGGTKTTFDTPEAKTSLQTLADLRPFMDPQATAFDQPRVQQQLLNGKAAVAIMFSGRMADLLKDDLTAFAGDFAFSEPPAATAGGDIGSTLSVDGWSIPTNTDIDPDLLFRLMAASISKDAAQQAVPAAYPARRGIATEKNTPYATAVQDALKNGATTPPLETWLGNMQNATAPVLLAAIAGKKSVADALAQCQSLGAKALAD